MARKTLLVPIDYGSNRSCDRLSLASEQTLQELIKYLIEHFDEKRQVIAHCVADLPERGMRPQDSRQWKGEILDRAIKTLLPRVVVPAKTSLDEAQNIRDALAKNGWEAENIIIFCDRWHARRLRFVWSRVFPGSEIEIHPLRCQWNFDYACTYMRSELRWVLHNIAGLLAMKCFGMNVAAEIKRRGG